ncbi:MAG: hypothetical protein M3176_02670 [Chloroflexota bacterium]|nr:hypothetical protein [Chloroflexota bacterium]
MLSGKQIECLAVNPGLHDQFPAEGFDESPHRGEVEIVLVLDTRDIDLRHAKRGGEFQLADLTPPTQLHQRVLA